MMGPEVHTLEPLRDSCHPKDTTYGDDFGFSGCAIDEFREEDIWNRWRQPPSIRVKFGEPYIVQYPRMTRPDPDIGWEWAGGLWPHEYFRKLWRRWRGR